MIGIARRRIPLLNGDGRGVIDGYEYVDLGLPSGLLFATCNVGASTETEYGDYYQWGTGSTKYANTNQYYGSDTGSANTLPMYADTARKVMGGSWRMPTKAEFDELIANTTYTFTTINGVNGGKFSKTVDGKERYVFFPAGGYYIGTLLNMDSVGNVWSSTPEMSFAYYLYFNSERKFISSSVRSRGQSVRGVISA